MFSFGLTWGAYDWLIKAGILKTFMIVASIQLVVCLLSIPMCKSHLSHTSLSLSLSAPLSSKRAREKEQSTVRIPNID